MKLIINRLVLSLTIAIIPFYLSAARMFILFNEDCMERLEYESANRNADPFVAYQVNVGDGEKVILEIGQESKNTTTKLPTPTIGCDNGVFNLPMVQKINSRIDEVFLVVKRNNRRYTVSPVNFATYFSVKGDVISVISPKYKFQFNTKEGAIGENISTEKTADVFFEGRLEQECTGAYVFRQIAQGSQTPYTDLVLIPEVGIIEMRSGRTLDQALTNGMKLEQVNDDSFDDYLEEKCEESLSDNVLANSKPGQAKEAEVTPSGAVGYDMTVKNGNVRQRIPSSTNQPSSNIPNTVNRAPANTNTALTPGGTNQYHTVKKGETLYRISKQYDISVGQIKSWNNLNSNLITTGSQLMVGTQAVAVDNTIADNTSTNQAQTNFSSNNNKPRYFPAPYNTTYRPNSNNEVITTKGVADSYQVKPGDTVASLAMRFGFTEKKFREINQLGDNDYIKIGESLKTSDCNCPTNMNNPTVEAPQEFNFVQKGSEVSTNDFDNQVTNNQNNTAGNSARNYPVNFSDTPIPVSSSNFNPPAEVNSNSTRSPSPLYTPRGLNQQNTNNPYETEQNTPRTTRQPSPYDAIIPNSFDTYSPIRTGSSDQSVRGLDYTPQNSNRKRHVVQEGEDIFQIARMYNLTTERLRTLNNLELGEVIIPTQKLFIE